MYSTGGDKMISINVKKPVPKTDMLTACGLLREIVHMGVLSNKDFNKIAKNMVNGIASGKTSKQLSIIDRLYDLSKDM